MFYFLSLDGSTVGTRKRLCAFGRRTRTRTLCILRTLCRHVTIGTPMVLSVFDDWYSVPFVKNSQKTVKQQKMTIGVPIVACLHRVRQIHKAAQTPLPCETSITCAWAVATASRPWTGLTVCVYMDVHASGSRSLPCAATLSSTY